MKKILIAILCITMIFSCMGVTAFAYDKPVFAIGKVYAVSGEVEVPVYITGIPKGFDNIMAVDFEYSYDTTELEYVTTNMGTATGSLFTASDGQVHWADATDISVDTPKINNDTVGEENPLFVITFKITDPSDEYTNIVVEKVNLSCGNIRPDGLFELINFSDNGYDVVLGRIVFDDAPDAGEETAPDGSEAPDGEKATFTISQVTATDFIVDVPVYITSLPNGLENIMAIDFGYSYDTSVLEYQSTKRGTATGNLFVAGDGKVHWADSTDITNATPKITADNVGKEHPLFTITFKVIDTEALNTDILCGKANFSGGVLLDKDTFEIVKASPSNYDIINGKITFNLPYVAGKKEKAYGFEGYRTITINVRDDAVPYVDGVKAIKVADRKYMFITDAVSPEITLNYNETAELVGWGRLHRADKVTALDALMALNICAGVEYEEFESDLNNYIKADPDMDHEITSIDALAINYLSHGKNVSVGNGEEGIFIEVESEEFDFE